MKYAKILQLAEQFSKMADRLKGKSLPQTGYEYRYVEIYRAVPTNMLHIKPMDYVTRSKKWAIGHAEHSVAVQEEPQHVLMAMVKSSDVYEAGNPGEYFYDGPEIKGKPVFVVKPET